MAGTHGDVAVAVEVDWHADNVTTIHGKKFMGYETGGYSSLTVEDDKLQARAYALKGDYNYAGLTTMVDIIAYLNDANVDLTDDTTRKALFGYLKKHADNPNLIAFMDAVLDDIANEIASIDLPGNIISAIDKVIGDNEPKLIEDLVIQCPEILRNSNQAQLQAVMKKNVVLADELWQDKKVRARIGEQEFRTAHPSVLRFQQEDLDLAGCLSFLPYAQATKSVSQGNLVDFIRRAKNNKSLRRAMTPEDLKHLFAVGDMSEQLFCDVLNFCIDDCPHILMPELFSQAASTTDLSSITDATEKQAIVTIHKRVYEDQTPFFTIGSDIFANLDFAKEAPVLFALFKEDRVSHLSDALTAKDNNNKYIVTDPVSILQAAHEQVDAEMLVDIMPALEERLSPKALGKYLKHNSWSLSKESPKTKLKNWVISKGGANQAEFFKDATNRAKFLHVLKNNQVRGKMNLNASDIVPILNASKPAENDNQYADDICRVIAGDSGLMAKLRIEHDNVQSDFSFENNPILKAAQWLHQETQTARRDTWTMGGARENVCCSIMSPQFMFPDHIDKDALWAVLTSQPRYWQHVAPPKVASWYMTAARRTAAQTAHDEAVANLKTKSIFCLLKLSDNPAEAIFGESLEIPNNWGNYSSAYLGNNKNILNRPLAFDTLLAQTRCAADVLAIIRFLVDSDDPTQTFLEVSQLEQAASKLSGFVTDGNAQAILNCLTLNVYTPVGEEHLAIQPQTVEFIKTLLRKSPIICNKYITGFRSYTGLGTNILFDSVGFDGLDNVTKLSFYHSADFAFKQAHADDFAVLFTVPAPEGIVLTATDIVAAYDAAGACFSANGIDAAVKAALYTPETNPAELRDDFTVAHIETLLTSGLWGRLNAADKTKFISAIRTRYPDNFNGAALLGYVTAETLTLDGLRPNDKLAIYRASDFNYKHENGGRFAALFTGDTAASITVDDIIVAYNDDNPPVCFAHDAETNLSGILNDNLALLLQILEQKPALFTKAIFRDALVGAMYDGDELHDNVTSVHVEALLRIGFLEALGQGTHNQNDFATRVAKKFIEEETTINTAALHFNAILTASTESQPEAGAEREPNEQLLAACRRAVQQHSHPRAVLVSLLNSPGTPVAWLQDDDLKQKLNEGEEGDFDQTGYARCYDIWADWLVAQAKESVDNFEALICDTGPNGAQVNLVPFTNRQVAEILQDLVINNRDQITGEGGFNREYLQYLLGRLDAGADGQDIILTNGEFLNTLVYDAEPADTINVEAVEWLAANHMAALQERCKADVELFLHAVAATLIQAADGADNNPIADILVEILAREALTTQLFETEPGKLLAYTHQRALFVEKASANAELFLWAMQRQPVAVADGNQPAEVLPEALTADQINTILAGLLGSDEQRPVLLAEEAGLRLAYDNQRERLVELVTADAALFLRALQAGMEFYTYPNVVEGVPGAPNLEQLVAILTALLGNDEQCDAVLAYDAEIVIRLLGWLPDTQYQLIFHRTEFLSTLMADDDYNFSDDTLDLILLGIADENVTTLTADAAIDATGNLLTDRVQTLLGETPMLPVSANLLLHLFKQPDARNRFGLTQASDLFSIFCVLPQQLLEALCDLNGAGLHNAFKRQTEFTNTLFSNSETILWIIQNKNTPNVRQYFDIVVDQANRAQLVAAMDDMTHGQAIFDALFSDDEVNEAIFGDARVITDAGVLVKLREKFNGGDIPILIAILSKPAIANACFYSGDADLVALLVTHLDDLNILDLSAGRKDEILALLRQVTDPNVFEKLFADDRMLPGGEVGITPKDIIGLDAISTFFQGWVYEEGVVAITLVDSIGPVDLGHAEKLCLEQDIPYQKFNAAKTDARRRRQARGRSFYRPEIPQAHTGSFVKVSTSWRSSASDSDIHKNTNDPNFLINTVLQNYIKNNGAEGKYDESIRMLVELILDTNDDISDELLTSMQSYLDMYGNAYALMRLYDYKLAKKFDEADYYELVAQYNSEPSLTAIPVKLYTWLPNLYTNQDLFNALPIPLFLEARAAILDPDATATTSGDSVEADGTAEHPNAPSVREYIKQVRDLSVEDWFALLADDEYPITELFTSDEDRHLLQAKITAAYTTNAEWNRSIFLFYPFLSRFFDRGALFDFVGDELLGTVGPGTVIHCRDGDVRRNGDAVAVEADAASVHGDLDVDDAHPPATPVTGAPVAGVATVGGGVLGDGGEPNPSAPAAGW